LSSKRKAAWWKIQALVEDLTMTVVPEGVSNKAEDEEDEGVDRGPLSFYPGEVLGVIGRLNGFEPQDCENPGKVYCR
jgi:hypothetical protein